LSGLEIACGDNQDSKEEIALSYHLAFLFYLKELGLLRLLKQMIHWLYSYRLSISKVVRE